MLACETVEEIEPALVLADTADCAVVVEGSLVVSEELDDRVDCEDMAAEDELDDGRSVIRLLSSEREALSRTVLHCPLMLQVPFILQVLSLG